MLLFLLRIPFSNKIFSSFEKYFLWDDFIMTLPSGLNVAQENSEYQGQCHSLLSFQLCLSFCAPLKAIFLGRSVLMLWSFSVYTSLRPIFQHSQVHNHQLYWIDFYIPFDFWIIISHTSYYNVTWPKFFSLP